MGCKHADEHRRAGNSITDANACAYCHANVYADTKSDGHSNGNNIYTIKVRASDDSGSMDDLDVNVEVTNVNERPEVDLAITDQTMTVGVSRIISLQGTFSDPDTNDTLTYTAAASPSGIATASVSNSDIALTLGALAAGSATITVTAADRTSGDADRLTASQAFTVTVDEPNAPPTFEEDTNPTRSVAENTVSGADVGSPVTASDDDSDTLSYSLSGTDAGSFRIVGFSGQIRTFDSLNFEMKNRYSVTVTADDGNGGTASIDVIINVNDVNEAPVGSEIGDLTLAHDVASRKIELSTYFSDPDTSDTLIYTAETPDTDVATVSVEGSTLTLERVSAGSATITVTAADRTSGHADRMIASQNFTVTVEAPALPTVTIEPLDGTVSVGEGQLVPFTLTADPASTSALTVNVRVSAEGSFLTGPRPSQVTIAPGSDNAQFTLRTADDNIDEANGTVTAIVRSGTGYIVGSPSSADVTIRDDDVPPVPTGLRANGNLVGGSVTLRWNSVSEATNFNATRRSRVTQTEFVAVMREEPCDSNGVCGSDANWESRTYTAATASTVKEADLAGLTKKKLYRVQVRAVIVDESAWSDFSLVFPTDSALGRETEVGTAPFHGYQAKNAQGSHEFRYVLCEETVPAGLNMTTQDMKDAVDEWEDTVTWSRGGANIITTTAYALPSDERCSTLAIPTRRGRFEVKFASSFRMGAACNPFAILPVINAPPACWRSTTWEATDLAQIDSGSILLNADRVAANWNRIRDGCSYLRHSIVHEVGHAFGIGNQRGFDYNRHPTNTMHSVMSYDDGTWHCKPQAYDIVALMALYQSQ